MQDRIKRSFFAKNFEVHAEKKPSKGSRKNAYFEKIMHSFNFLNQNKFIFNSFFFKNFFSTSVHVCIHMHVCTVFVYGSTLKLKIGFRRECALNIHLYMCEYQYMRIRMHSKIFGI